MSAESATADYLQRIAALNPRLGAFVHIDDEGALETARDLDRLLAAGDDLGPLMGVPIAVKDVIAVEGMPTRAGSRVDVTDIIGPEGTFVRRLRGAGCVILGKTATVEFALGAGPHAQRTPWNPWDATEHRIPGGSSSGSAVAVAASMCAFAIGTDTGGSVRIPAALSGVTGFKPSRGRWPLDGVLPVAPSFDTIGILARSAADIALIFAAIEGTNVPPPPDLHRIVLGRADIGEVVACDPEVGDGVEAALAVASANGAAVEDTPFPEAAASRQFAFAVAAEFLTVLTRDRFLAGRDAMDPAVGARIASGLDVETDRYTRTMQLRPGLSEAAATRLAGFDAIVTPTVPMVAPALASFAEDGFEHAYHGRITALTRPANVLDLCAVTIPIAATGTKLPAGLQLLGRRGDEARVLSIAAALAERLTAATCRPVRIS